MYGLRSAATRRSVRSLSIVGRALMLRASAAVEAFVLCWTATSGRTGVFERAEPTREKCGGALVWLSLACLGTLPKGRHRHRRLKQRSRCSQRPTGDPQRPNLISDDPPLGMRATLKSGSFRPHMSDHLYLSYCWRDQVSHSRWQGPPFARARAIREARAATSSLLCLDRRSVASLSA